jgi:hypothetical protein
MVSCSPCPANIVGTPPVDVTERFEDLKVSDPKVGRVGIVKGKVMKLDGYDAGS